MWWITVRDLEGGKMHVNLAHIRAISGVRSGESDIAAGAKITWASGQVQFVASTVDEIMRDSIAWKFKGCA
jgi:hypothetical protein